MLFKQFITSQDCPVKLQFAPEEQNSERKLLKGRLFRPSRGETIMANNLFIAISPILGQFFKIIAIIAYPSKDLKFYRTTGIT
jgi:hypothetical protein